MQEREPYSTRLPICGCVSMVTFWQAFNMSVKVTIALLTAHQLTTEPKVCIVSVRAPVLCATFLGSHTCEERHDDDKVASKLNLDNGLLALSGNRGVTDGWVGSFVTRSFCSSACPTYLCNATFAKEATRVVLDHCHNT